MPPQGMPPGMPPQGMPPGMPPGRGPLPPGIVNPGGQGVGIRNRGPASPQSRTSVGAGSPVTSVQQRGPQPTIAQQNQKKLGDAGRLKGA